MSCDRYAYEVVAGGAHPTVTKGVIWFHDSVPFGVVKQTGTTKDEDGSVLSSYEKNYVDAGTGAKGTAKLLAQMSSGSSRPPTSSQPESERPDAPASYTLADAYNKGLIKLTVEAHAADGGRSLQFSMVSKSKEAIQVAVPDGEIELTAGAPIGTLRIAAHKGQTFDLAPGASSPEISCKQLGKRGAVEGTFSLVVYDGEPLYSGSVTMGAL
jgi:hypothetical protein